MILRPTYFIDGDITDLDVNILTRDGIKGLMIDLDSTLMAPKAGSLSNQVQTWLDEANDRFEIVILSNNKRKDYLASVESKLNIHVIGHAAKPFKQGFEKALNHLKLPKKEVVIIGDRALTDILGGCLFGVRSVLVMPLKDIKEPKLKTYVRNIERALARRN